MVGPRHALTLRSKDQRSIPNINRPAWVCMSIRLHNSLVIYGVQVWAIVAAIYQEK